MQTIGFQDALEGILAKDNRYQAEAYAFLRDALDATLKKRKKTRKDATGHVSAAELLDGFRQHALQEFGPMTITVLSYWGVANCEDVGNLVFNLIQAGVFGKTDEDTIEGFRNGYDFEEVFAEPFRPSSLKLSEPGSDVVGRNA